MSKVILDAAMRAKLTGLTEKVALYDESGGLLGYYLPPEPPNAFAGIPVEGPFTAAELEQAFAQTDPGRPLEDILRDLREGR
ncbi:MAG TPA: hypothetical protein VGE74_00030 [Gemmata sp.]